MIHIVDIAGDNSTNIWWLEEAVSRGLSFDVFGNSCYPVWHGEPSSWGTKFSELATLYPELQFVITEYGDTYREANNIIHGVHNGIGSFIWEPTADGELGAGTF
jgi:arabinogalactan endo-1,4-beta-galactosidase